MSEKYRLMMIEGLVIWAFGCAVNGADAAAAAISLLAAVLLVYIYGAEKMFRKLLPVLLLADLLLITAGLTGLSAVFPSLGWVLVADSAAAIMTVYDPREVMDRNIRGCLMIFAAYTALSFLVPSADLTVFQLLVMTVLIFAPVTVVYALQTLRETVSSVDAQTGIS